jgi:hypothetical protein
MVTESQTSEQAPETCKTGRLDVVNVQDHANGLPVHTKRLTEQCKSIFRHWNRPQDMLKRSKDMLTGSQDMLTGPLGMVNVSRIKLKSSCAH